MTFGKGYWWRQEEGQALFIALAFIACFGVVAASLGRYATVNLMASERLRETRSVQFAADGAVQTALNWARLDANVPLAGRAPTSCFPPQALNGVSIRVECSATVAVPTVPPIPGVLVQTVTFQACRSSVSVCQASSALLVAEAQIRRVITSPASRTLTVTAWSV